MRLHFYGTGASEGVPSMFCECAHCEAARRIGGRDLRARSCCAIDSRLMIDFPPDVFAHSLRDGLDMRRIEAILCTHAHPDHLYPQELVNLVTPMAIRGAGKDIGIHGPGDAMERVSDAIRRHGLREMPLAVRTLEPGAWQSIAGFDVLPLKTWHDPSLTCYIYVIAREGRALLYGCDSGMFPEEVWAALASLRLDAAVLDSTFADAPHEPCGHMGLAENRQIVRRLRSEGCLKPGAPVFATHFRHSFAPLAGRIAPLYAAEGMVVAYDGLEAEI